MREKRSCWRWLGGMVESDPHYKWLPSSSSGLGRSPLKAETGVRFPVGALKKHPPSVGVFLMQQRSEDRVSVRKLPERAKHAPDSPVGVSLDAHHVVWWFCWCSKGAKMEFPTGNSLRESEALSRFPNWGTFLNCSQVINVYLDWMISCLRVSLNPH